MQSLISFSQFFPAEELLLLHDGKIMYQTLELTEDENGNLRAVPAGKAPIAFPKDDKRRGNLPNPGGYEIDLPLDERQTSSNGGGFSTPKR